MGDNGEICGEVDAKVRSQYGIGPDAGAADVNTEQPGKASAGAEE